MPNARRLEGLLVGQDVILVREEDYFLPLQALAKLSGLSTARHKYLLNIRPPGQVPRP
jgi:hypothetical protein